MMKSEIFFGLESSGTYFLDHAITARGSVFISGSSIKSEQAPFFSLRELCRNGTFLL